MILQKNVFQQNSSNVAANIQIPIPNKYLGCGYKLKGLVFCRNNGWIIENMDKRLTVAKLGDDSLVKNTPNAPEFICLPKPKSFGFQ